MSAAPNKQESNDPENSGAERLILGVDPGLNVTGYGVLKIADGGFTLVEAGVVRTRQRGSMGERLKELHDGICEIVQSYSPTAMALEELYSHYARPRTSILMGHARGVICLAAAQHEVTVVNYAATQVKRILTGNGRAPKSQMQDAVCREFGLLAPPNRPTWPTL